MLTVGLATSGSVFRDLGMASIGFYKGLGFRVRVFGSGSY